MSPVRDNPRRVARMTADSLDQPDNTPCPAFDVERTKALDVVQTEAVDVAPARPNKCQLTGRAAG